jgi:glutathionylspermidine synthase
MQRIKINPRPNFSEAIQSQGLLWSEGYYHEDAVYAFGKNEVEAIDVATHQLFELCVLAMDKILENDDLLARFKIPTQFHQLLKTSWQKDYVSLYGRFDLAFNPTTEDIKLLEFNADTPTSLLEASVIQWYWLQDYNQMHGQNYDQYNIIHEHLESHIQSIKDEHYLSNELTFCCNQISTEDYVTLRYLESIFHDLGFNTQFKDISALSVDLATGAFDEPGDVFKLYPWEWMMHEDFANYLLSDQYTQWVEPMYKAIWSNKMFMVILYELFPDSKYVLKASTKPDDFVGTYVRKPLLSREGANVSIIKNNQTIAATQGDYGEEGFIYQAYFELPSFDGYRPVIGSWLIGGQASGIGIRESAGLITDNKSRFINHYIY